MHILHCNPLGKSMFAEFIGLIRDAGAQGQAGRTALILPSPYLLEQARAELRRTELPAWEFPRVLSLDELADSLSGLRKISRLEQELIVADIVKASQDERLQRCFGKVLDFSGFVSALTRLFDEFKLAAVTPDELETAMEALQGEAESDEERDAAIASLFTAYHERMKACGVADLGGSYLLAVDALEQPTIELPLDRIFMAEFSLLSPLRLKLVEALKQRTSVEIGICFEQGRPEVFSAVEPIYQTLVGMGFKPVFHGGSRAETPALSQIRRELYRERPTALTQAAGVSVLLSPDRGREIAVAADAVKKLLVSGECNPGDVAVVVREPAAYPDLRRIFSERGIPVDLPDNVEVSGLALSRLIFAWMDWIQAGGARAAAMPVLKSPYVADLFGWQADELEKAVLGEVILTWQDWSAAIRRQAPDEATGRVWTEGLQRLQQKAALWLRPTPWAERAQCLTEWLELLDVPAVLRRRRAVGILDLSRTRAELGAWEALLDAAGQLADCGGLLSAETAPVTLGEFADALRQILQDRRIPISARDEAGVRVVSPGAASGMQFPVVLILGLTEGEFPSLPRESWLYADRERRTLAEAGVFLITAPERRAVEDFSFAIAAAMATQKLILSAVADSETLPSLYLEEIIRLFDKNTVEIHRFGPQQVVAEKSEEAWSRRELLCGALNAVRQRSLDSCGWQRIYDALKDDIPEDLPEAAAIEAAREGKYNGMIDPELIPISRFSASALERYAVCPFAFFVTDVLGMGDWKEAESGMDSLAAGALWHEVLAAFLSRRRGRRLLASERDEYARELEELLQESVAAMERQGRIAPDIWWKFERQRTLEAMLRWLDAELETQQTVETAPEHFEWAFGLEPWPGCDPASSAEPLTLGPTDRPIFLQGKVDRIDCAAANCRVIDYKTGQAPKAKDIEQGMRLQVPVYMMAVEALLGKQVETGEYQPVKRPSSPLVLPAGKSTKQELFTATEQFVSRNAADIRSGAFPPRSVVCPDYCTARTFCRKVKDLAGNALEGQQDE